MRRPLFPLQLAGAVVVFGLFLGVIGVTLVLVAGHEAVSGPRS